MLLSVVVRTFIVGIVRPDLLALAVLLVFEPVAFILGSVSVMVTTESVSLVILPFAIIDVTVCMNESTASVCLVALPVAFIDGAVYPELNTTSILLPGVVPFALIARSVLELFLLLENSVLCVVIGWRRLEVEVT